MNPETPTNAPPKNPPATNNNWLAKLKQLNTPQKLLALVAAVFVALILTGLIYQAFKEEAPSPTISVPATAAVSITSDGFIPATITIKANTQLIWTNNDSSSHQPAADPHPIHDSIEGFDSNTTLLPGDSLSFTFEKPGTYTLHDHLNPLDPKYRLSVVVE